MACRLPRRPGSQDLQLAVFEMLGLILLVRQGHIFLFHVCAGADEDTVVVAPRGEAEAPMDFQILDAGRGCRCGPR